MRLSLVFLLILTASVFTVYGGSVNLSDYATPNDQIDDSAGFQAAFNDVASSGGGTIVVGDGTWDIKSRINLNNIASNVTSTSIVGNKGATLRLDLYDEDFVFVVGNHNQLNMSNLIIVPAEVTGGGYDTGYFLISAYTGQTIIQNCNFYGVRAKYDMIRTFNTDLIVEKTIFGGTAASGAHIRATNFSGVTVRDTQFLDYANYLDKYYSKTPYNSGDWIKAENDAMPVINALSSKTVTIVTSRFDEGAPTAIRIKNVPFANIQDISVNVSGIEPGAGLLFDNVKYANVRMSQFGFTTNHRPAIVAFKSTLDAVGLAFGAGVYFAYVDNSTGVIKDRCNECSEINYGTEYPARNAAAARVVAPEKDKKDPARDQFLAMTGPQVPKGR